MCILANYVDIAADKETAAYSKILEVVIAGDKLTLIDNNGSLTEEYTRTDRRTPDSTR
jgi:hypothetical protein